MRIKETRLYLGFGGGYDGTTESRVRDLDKGEKMPASDPPLFVAESVTDGSGTDGAPAVPLSDWAKDAPAKKGGN